MNLYKKKLFINIIFLILLLLFFFLSLDFIASNTVLKKKNCYNFEKFYYDLKKNCVGKDKFKSSFPTVDVYTDEFGLRISKNNKKTTGAKNILIFGDSFTFGVGLNYQDTYVGLLEKKIKEYNFYNFAVGSYSPTVHQYRLKQAINNQIIPNKIILFLDLTDVFDEGSSRWNLNGKNNKPSLIDDELFKTNNKKKDSFKNKNFKLSREFAALLNTSLRILRSKTKNKYRNDDQKTLGVKRSFQGQFTYTKLSDLNKIFWTEEIFKNGIIKIQDNINEISEIAKKYNSEFYLVVYPWAETLEDGEKEFNWSNFGKNLCLNNKCKLIDTIPHFKKYKEKNNNWVNELYFVNDEHFNKGGAKFIANLVKNKIIN